IVPALRRPERKFFLQKICQFTALHIYSFPSFSIPSSGILPFPVLQKRKALCRFLPAPPEAPAAVPGRFGLLVFQSGPGSLSFAPSLFADTAKAPGACSDAAEGRKGLPPGADARFFLPKPPATWDNSSLPLPP